MKKKDKIIIFEIVLAIIFNLWVILSLISLYFELPDIFNYLIYTIHFELLRLNIFGFIILIIFYLLFLLIPVIGFINRNYRKHWKIHLYLLCSIILHCIIITIAIYHLLNAIPTALELMDLLSK